MSKLRLDALSKRYGSTTAVGGVTLDVQEGEFVSLLGPSGCGKTTTLRMIAGFVPPSAGTISLDDRLLSSADDAVPPEKRGMSMIFQSYAIWPHMTVAENVGFGLKIKGLRGVELERRVKAILTVVQLEALAARYPAELSGGQQQRVALARALVVEPQVLLLDEPLSNLDANLREEMRFEIRRLHERFSMTTVYVTHDQAEAMAVSDTIVVMNGGRVEQVGAPYAIYNSPRTPFVAGFIGRTNLVSGRRDAQAVALPGFQVPEGAPLNGAGVAAIFSIRPENIQLSRQPHAGEAAGFVGRATVEHRSYLGTQWEYRLRLPGTDFDLRVAAHPSDVFDVGETLWLTVRSDRICEIEGETL